jgi:YVTN family beta-propeller protein
LLVQGNLVYVANSGLDKLTYQYGQGTVSIIDATTRQVIQTVAVPRNPQKMEAAPDGAVHVVCTGDYGYQTPSIRGNIAVIGVEYDPVTFTPQYVVTDTIPIGHDPSGIAFSHDSLAFVLGGGFDINIGGYLDVYNSYSYRILHNGSDSLVIGAGPTNIVTDEKDGRVFVSSFYNDEIQELNPGTGTVIARYPVGDGPGGMAPYTRP